MTALLPGFTGQLYLCEISVVGLKAGILCCKGRLFVSLTWRTSHFINQAKYCTLAIKIFSHKFKHSSLLANVFHGIAVVWQRTGSDVIKPHFRASTNLNMASGFTSHQAARV
jgi:hypothetical protein